MTEENGNHVISLTFESVGQLLPRNYAESNQPITLSFILQPHGTKNAS